MNCLGMPKREQPVGPIPLIYGPTWFVKSGKIMLSAHHAHYALIHTTRFALKMEADYHSENDDDFTSPIQMAWLNAACDHAPNVNEDKKKEWDLAKQQLFTVRFFARMQGRVTRSWN